MPITATVVPIRQPKLFNALPRRVHHVSRDPVGEYATKAPAITFRLSDQLLDALGDFFQESRFYQAGITFEQFLMCPRKYGFLRVFDHSINEPKNARLLPRQRYVAGCIARYCPPA